MPVVPQIMSLARVSNNKFAIAYILTIVSLILYVYWPGLHGPFILDDLPTIDVAKIQSLSLKQLIEVSFANETGPLGRPLSIASFALSDYFLGSSPFAFKSVNLILHLMIFFLVLTFSYLVVLFTPAKRFALIISLLTATIWVSHPLLLSTVLYAVQRMTQLSAFFVLLGVNSYLYGRLRLILSKPYPYAYIANAWLICFPLAVLSKETGILFPWYILCLEYFILKFRAPKHALLIKKLNYTVSTALLFTALVYYKVNLDKFLALFADKGITVFDRLLTQVKALVFYLQQIILPNITKLSLYHDDFQVSTKITLEVAMCALLLASLVFCIYVFRRKQPIIAFGLAWFFISQAIESTIIPLEMVFEHRVYIGICGILLIPSYYFIYYFYKLKTSIRYLTGILVSFIILLNMQITFTLSKIWSSNEKFLEMTAFYHPNSPRTHIELANYFLMKEKYQDAFIELDIAQNLEPHNAGIALHKILILCRATHIPDIFYIDAYHRIKKSTISPYVLLVLDQMVENMFQQQCNSVDKSRILSIIRLALENPFLDYKPRYKAMLLHLESGLHVLENNIPQSIVLLSKSYEANPKQIDPLIQKAYLELKHGMINDAHNTINQIQNCKHYLRYPYDKVDKLKNFYDKVQSTKDR